MRIKIVPNDEPNAEGRWTHAPGDPPQTRNWCNSVDAVAEHVPAGWHVVSIAQDLPNEAC